MKKIVILMMVFMISFITGCDDVKDAAEVKIDVTQEADPQEVTITAQEFIEDIDLTETDGYDDQYDDLLKDIEIRKMEYKIPSGSGDTGVYGKLTFYATDFEGATDVATSHQITDGLRLNAGEKILEWTEVPLIAEGRNWFEDTLLSKKKVRVWGSLKVYNANDEVCTSCSFTATIETRYDIRIKANPLDLI